jgi:hypothetical protein
VLTITLILVQVDEKKRKPGAQAGARPKRARAGEEAGDVAAANGMGLIAAYASDSEAEGDDVEVRGLLITPALYEGVSVHPPIAATGLAYG